MKTRSKNWLEKFMALRDDLKTVLQRRGALAIVGYAFEAFGLLVIFGILRLLPLDWASAVGGFIGRNLGPMLPVHKRADVHITRVYPDMPAVERKRIALGAWDNLGRTM